MMEGLRRALAEDLKASGLEGVLERGHVRGSEGTKLVTVAKGAGLPFVVWATVLARTKGCLSSRRRASLSSGQEADRRSGLWR